MRNQHLAQRRRLRENKFEDLAQDVDQEKMRSAIAVGIIGNDEGLGTRIAQVIQASEGYELWGRYPDTQSAVQGITRSQPHVLILDAVTLGNSEPNCIAEIKDVAPASQILLLSTEHNDGHVMLALRAGAIGHLSRDTAPPDILKSVYDVHQGSSIVSDRIARKLVQYYQTQKDDIAPQQNAHDQPMPDPSQTTGEQALSLREQEILELLVEGLRHKEIARRCHRSEHTVREHLRRIYSKLNVSTSREAVVKYLRHAPKTSPSF
jgi:two-component system, NarL family, response regulator LiaR